jgi:hypothetical protein
MQSATCIRGCLLRAAGHCSKPEWRPWPGSGWVLVRAACGHGRVSRVGELPDVPAGLAGPHPLKRRLPHSTVASAGEAQADRDVAWGKYAGRFACARYN